MKFDFDEMNLMPRRCVVSSRSECDTSIVFGPHKFKMPIMPANMESVVSEDICIKLAKEGYFYVMHRFGTDSYQFTLKMKSLGLVSSISIGVNQESYDLIDRFVSTGVEPDYITIDIAHGHSIMMENMLKYVKSKLSSFVIAGNICTQDAVMDLEEWGADACKVGISNGSACTTHPATGFGNRNCQASTILDCIEYAKKPIIADGGIKVPGDIAKALVLGASMVMIGGMLTGFIDSPGNLVELDGKMYKEYWGSASSHQSGKTNRIEGKKNLISYKDKYILDEYKYLIECLQSSISYGGGNNISCFLKVEYI